MRGRLAIAYLNPVSREIWLLDTEKTCRRAVDSGYVDSQAPVESRPLSPHLSGNLITWVRNKYVGESSTSAGRVTSSWLVTVTAASRCRLKRSPGIAPNLPGPEDPFAYDLLQSTGREATSVAVDRDRIYVTLRGSGLVMQPFKR